MSGLNSFSLVIIVSSPALLFALITFPVQAGQTLVYPGASLTVDPFGNVDSLTPSASSPSGNSVTMTGGVVAGNVNGAAATAAATTVENNLVTITGGLINGSVWGGGHGQCS